MTKPQTDLEEIKELHEREVAHRRSIDRRVEVQLADQGIVLTPEQIAARKRRNLIIALSVGAFILLVFAITLTQLQANVLDRPL